MQVVLVMFRAGGDQRSFSISRDSTVIGRREDCDLRIPVGDVSRKHCRLRRGDGGLKVEDMGSSNGTFVNDERVTEADVNAGDVIRVGPVQFVVQVDGVPADDEIVRPADPQAAAGDPGESAFGDPLTAAAGGLAGASMAGSTEDALGGAPAASAAHDEEPFELNDDAHPVATAGSAAPNSMTIDVAPSAAAAGDFENAFLDEAAADEPFSLSDESKVGEAAGHAPALPADAEAELEEIELESLPATEVAPAAPGNGAAPGHAAAATADDDEWDFALDEPEAEPLGEFHLDEADPAHHPQPHGKG